MIGAGIKKVNGILLTALEDTMKTYIETSSNAKPVQVHLVNLVCTLVEILT